jgi:hypothetical protein
VFVCVSCCSLCCVRFGFLAFVNYLIFFVSLGLFSVVYCTFRSIHSGALFAFVCFFTVVCCCCVVVYYWFSGFRFPVLSLVCCPVCSLVSLWCTVRCGKCCSFCCTVRSLFRVVLFVV